jgi:hypothetical protein
MFNWIRSLDRVLKGEATKPAALRGGRLDLPVGGLTVVLVLLGAVYGACMGAFALVDRWDPATRHQGYLQMAYSAVKVPMLFFLTLIVTFPSLYVFNALVGSRLSFRTVLRLLVAALGVMLSVLASFGTIVVFFSLCTTSYPFMVLLNVAMFAVAGLLGMGFLLQTLHRLSLAQAAQSADEAATAALAAAPLTAPDGTPFPAAAAPPPPLPPAPSPGALDRLHPQGAGPHVRTVFRIWVLVFALVGAQMGWVLRPFIGKPGVPVSFFRERESNFFEAVYNKIVDVAAGEGTETSRRRKGVWNRRGAAPYSPPRQQQQQQQQPPPQTQPATP